jgi:hypothetical protein
MNDPGFEEFHSFLSIVSLMLLAVVIYIFWRILKYVVWGL